MDRQDPPDSSGCQDDTRCCIDVSGRPAPLYRIMVGAWMTEGIEMDTGLLAGMSCQY